MVDQNKAQLVPDAGDTFHGQAFATLQQGESIAKVMDMVGYDAVVPGNHDFSYGINRLKDLDSNYDFAVLAANMADEQGNTFFEYPYLIKQVTLDNGKSIDVGVVGITDTEFETSIIDKNKQGVVFSDEEKAATDTANPVIVLFVLAVSAAAIAVSSRKKAKR